MDYVKSGMTSSTAASGVLSAHWLAVISQSFKVFVPFCFVFFPLKVALWAPTIDREHFHG